MSEQLWSWVQAFSEGALSEAQLEALQASVDAGDAETLLEAARIFDFIATHTAGEEPGPQAF